MASYQDLMAQKAALEKQAAALTQQIETARRSEHTAAVAKIKALMAEHGVTLAELGNKATGRPGTKKSKGTTAGRKVAAKYRNAATGDSWSGRGLQPNWLKAALASGRKLDDFAV
ncbi:H-NS histone family protein [uncultured Methylibium sp.]|uniref:H-NS histone family protein n=1 Tax=uncultured Methylibium sp. TaxID=381093 RepID=UPI0025EA63D7|nr:H-NS histone family protein [uncultured Methylibium sp.]